MSGNRRGRSVSSDPDDEADIRFYYSNDDSERTETDRDLSMTTIVPNGDKNASWSTNRSFNTTVSDSTLSASSFGSMDSFGSQGLRPARVSYDYEVELGTPPRRASSLGSSSSPSVRILDSPLGITPQSTPVRAFEAAPASPVQYVGSVRVIPDRVKRVEPIEKAAKYWAIVSKLTEASCPHFEHFNSSVGFEDSGIFRLDGYATIDTLETAMKARNKNEISLSNAKMMIFQIIFAFACAQRLRISHGDVNPKNIVIDRDGFIRRYRVNDEIVVQTYDINVRIVNLELGSLEVNNSLKDVVNGVRPILQTWGGRDAEKMRFFNTLNKAERDGNEDLIKLLAHPFFGELRDESHDAANLMILPNQHALPANRVSPYMPL